MSMLLLQKETIKGSKLMAHFTMLSQWTFSGAAGGGLCIC